MRTPTCFRTASIIAILTICFCVADAQAQYGAADPLPGQPERPCGPDSLTGPLRFLVPQGFRGANFRGSCITHDACYDKFGVDRQICEAQFKSNLQDACACSKRPIQCRMFARFMANSVNRFGESAFQSAQQIAAQKQ